MEVDVECIEIPQSDVKERRRFLVKLIEDTVRDLLQSVDKNETPKILFDDGRNSGWSSNSSSSMFSESEGSGTSSSGSREKTLKFTANKCRQRFALIMRVLEHVHGNLVNNLDNSESDFYSTRRSFFYTLKNEDIKRFVKREQQVEWAINQVTMMLECGPWEIGFYTTSKGLVAGDLSLHLNDGRCVNYEQRNCLLVPDVVANVTRIRTSADFVLVVEKDSVFQKLLHDELPASSNCILVTGKGYPDVPTRMLVNLLSEKVRLPVYALVDANPYGFEIMCVYRFGTLNNSGYRKHLLCSEMRWLGVHQEDLSLYNIPRVRLTKGDYKKIGELMDRSYVDSDFSKHLMEMKQGKAEIESVQQPKKRFLADFYIPEKIRLKKYC
ncbi:hypothetical protein TSAR_008584 [Trichomalopsis sarcophagae]|uniref:Topoisomerase 6 subunit A/Spo11 TOPRIM domain-containing protein n=1 Tax=Trichomalopsis sarcophagae TaxID=543379 RepID=A0A232EYQ2_9HYME|nr:hypothetical protein TSAR_008584 [Trichomalopsis sarcophagae]